MCGIKFVCHITFLLFSFFDSYTTRSYNFSNCNLLFTKYTIIISGIIFINIILH